MRARKGRDEVAFLKERVACLNIILERECQVRVGPNETISFINGTTIYRFLQTVYFQGVVDGLKKGSSGGGEKEGEKEGEKGA